MGVADARAIHPALEILEAEPEADRRLLESLADWCDRYTPLVALDGDDGLFLDITGCAHLFGSERALLDDLLARLLQQGFCARAGLASTAGMAWASARFLDVGITAPGEEEDTLASLPLAALRLDPATRASLESVGLRNAGAVLATARAPIVRRFGSLVMTRLDQALGRIEEAISPRHPAPSLSVERHLAEPVVSAGDIETLTAMLAATLVKELERRGEGARTLQLTLFRVDGDVSRIGVRTSRPLRDAAIICRLLRERLVALESDIDAGCGFELVRLAAPATARYDMRQADLSGDEPAGEEELAVFADRVRARLGRQALLKPVPHESHIPERAVRMLPFAEAPQSARPVPADTDMPFPADRPIRLFSQPEPIDVSAAEVPEGPPAHFYWRRSLHVVARAEGPERIAPEWWRSTDAEPTRDYFRIEVAGGRRYWLYREGLYGASPSMPRWFMHGIFA